MYERFTDRARKVIQLAHQEAQRFNHEYIGTEHILLGLVAEGAGVAANVLKNLDIDLGKIRREVEKIVQHGPGGDPPITGRLPHTPRAQKVIEYAIEEAQRLGHNYVGTEHQLLGLLREDQGVAAQILMNLGVELDQVREEVVNLLGPREHKLPVALKPQTTDVYTVSDLTPEDAVAPAEPPTEEQLHLIEEQIDRINVEKERLVLDGDFERAAKLRDEAQALSRLVAWYRWYRGRG
jgi:ATP-dependent Clp protease ATP-binding subunit ClpA